MWTSTSKVIQSNDVQKEKIQLDLDFPKSITTSILVQLHRCTSAGSVTVGKLANKKIAPAAAQLVPNGEEASHRCS
jgi:hypothetical protein